MDETGTWPSSELCRVMVGNEDMMLDVLGIMRNHSSDPVDPGKLPKCTFYPHDRECQCCYQDDTA
jgi:hypothetical protein